LFASGQIGPKALIRSLLFAVRHWPRFGRHVWKKNKSYLAGMRCTEVERLAHAFVTERLVPLLRERLHERIACHRAAGDHVLLMTGSPEFLARPLAQAIAADSWIATSCAHEDGIYLASVPTCHPFGGEKLRLAQDAARRLGFSLAEGMAYADTGEDIELLAAVGDAVAVAPDRMLAKRARSEGWEIISEKQILPARRWLAGIGQRA
jgi:HAD superfamily hydrolase (TIGR01490 family)